MGRHNHYFEGWYIKMVTQEHMLAFIPGYAINDGIKEAFIQVIVDGTSYFIPYRMNQFKRSKETFFIQIGDTVFTRKGCRIRIHTDDVIIDGDIRFGKLNTLTYSIMGPLKYIPFLGCQHEVISMDHALYGTLTVNGSNISFKGGRGYIESDRGSSFPESYYWTQCNHFKKSFTSVMAAVADVSLYDHSFLGTTCAIRYKGKDYRIATYLGAKIRLYTDKKIIITQNNMMLKITLLKANPVTLSAPINGAMIRTVEEQSSCTVHYFFRMNHRVLIDETCEQASLESSFISKVFAQ